MPEFSGQDGIMPFRNVGEASKAFVALVEAQGDSMGIPQADQAAAGFLGAIGMTFLNSGERASAQTGVA